MLDEHQVEDVFRILSRAMPGRTSDAKGPKGQPDAFRSCISCMLSAQSLDRNTAKAARALFALATTPEDMLALVDRDIAAAIKPCGLYNIKTRSIRRFCEALLAEHDGVVPDTREGLMRLPGIGRKCADIVLSFTFGKDVIAVDTHVHRVCNRIGLTDAKTADRTAQQLEERSPEWALADGHFWLIQFGKRVCISRGPRCDTCPVSQLCEAYPAITS
ncbi:endonuclease III domain-containing protein [Qipengyuania vesicularis]|uniref:endonuclease III domain-containing protein n=1 Tax=Qipengyuania vesicularis TaxID=2867232 RepID=UPI001C87A6AE|nr:endonuclease III [Qipengyuania vesicularis]MBX7528048.1 endonuclease III [Qipengyuania vesicularis]